MPHPALINKTSFAFEALLLTDEESVPQFVPCVQATFAIGPQGALSLLEKQPPVKSGGQWRGDPAKTSMIFEPQIAFAKLGTDVVLMGHAYAPAPGAAESLVGIRLGLVQKTAKVFGDRRFVHRLGISGVSRPEPFERIPIVYERAFGGWDKHDADPLKHRHEARNPVGVGFRVSSPGAEEQMLPNFEDPQHLIKSWGDTPPPAGFGFIAPDWQPRLGFAGTYDMAWNKTRRPLLPRDFDRRFFNAGSPGLITPEHLKGDEAVVVIGAAPEGRVDFRLPGLPAPYCLVELRGRKRVPLQTALDTVIVDMDARTLTLMWRNHLPVRNGLHDVLSIEMHPDQAAAQARIAIAIA